MIQIAFSGGAPRHAVKRVMEMKGPRGGTLHVLVLECGSFSTRRLKGAPPDSIPCVACFVTAQLRQEEIQQTANRLKRGRSR